MLLEMVAEDDGRKWPDIPLLCYWSDLALQKAMRSKSCCLLSAEAGGQLLGGLLGGLLTLEMVPVDASHLSCILRCLDYACTFFLLPFVFALRF